MQALLGQGRHLLILAKPMLAGLDDVHLGWEPVPGAKTAGWLLGHLALTADYARHLCGRSMMCPAEWRGLFSPGTEPLHEADAYPRMAILCEYFERASSDLLDAIAEADPAVLGQDNPFLPMRSAFPSIGDFVAYIAGAHLAYHLGQLVGWRAAAGMGRVRQPERSAAGSEEEPSP